ncbi:MAG TPA: hypothetical protein DCL21_00860 [Alphaproteobacteria bacterium]|nr:hypothetical protein [Alphaproteobacteria bacterium]
MNYKQGAMFGLDARIALAIFGALSVISGAALYSAIQKAKVTSLITEMNELGKAVDSYQLDTGVLPPFDIAAHNHMDAMELLNSSVYNWNGPYISGEQYGTTGTEVLNLKHSTYNYIGIRRMETASWGNLTIKNCTSASTPCALYIIIVEVPKSMADAIDQRIDGTLDDSNGKVRLYPAGTGWSVWMQYRPYSYQ